MIAVALPDRRGRRRDRHEKDGPVAMDAPGDDPRELIAQRGAQAMPALFLVLQERVADRTGVGGQCERRR